MYIAIKLTLINKFIHDLIIIIINILKYNLRINNIINNLLIYIISVITIQIYIL